MMPDDERKLSARAVFWRHFLTVILVLLALAVTAWLLWRVVGGVPRVMERLNLTYPLGYRFLIAIAIIFVAGLFATNRAVARRYFITGILVLLPLAITVWLLWRIISGVEGGVQRVLERFNWTYIPGYGFLVVIAIIFVAGLLANNLIGRKLVRFVESLVTKIPFVSKVYLTVQQIRDAFIGREHALFQSVAVIEYPRAGLYTICFITSRAEGEVQHKTEEQVVCVFVPTTPNPTSGFLLFVPEDKLIPLSMTVEEAMKLVISGGALVPQHKVDELQHAEPAASPETDREASPDQP